MLKFHSGQEIRDSLQLLEKLHKSIFFLHVNSSNAIILYSRKKIYRYYLLLPTEWKNWNNTQKDQYVNTYVKPLKNCIVIIDGNIAIAIDSIKSIAFGDRLHTYLSETLCFMHNANLDIRIVMS